jgi:hypothetical protein
VESAVTRTIRSNLKLAGVGVGLVVALSACFVPPPTGHPALVTFSSANGATAGWTTTDGPTGSTDSRSIEVVSPANPTQPPNHPYGNANLVFADSSAPAADNPPSFSFKASTTGPSLGAPRLVIRFSGGGDLELRPLAYAGNVWTTVSGDGNLWDNNGGTCGYLYATTYATGLACHAGETVTSVSIQVDSGYAYPAGLTILVDDIHYDGTTISTD